MRRLLITGGSGYLGGELVRQAGATNQWQITATYGSHPQSAEAVAFVPLDLRDQALVHALIASTKPDVIIHTAYVQREPDLWAISADGAGAVAHAAAAVGARLIHMSSDALFDGERTGLYTEADQPSPITPYGSAKAAAESQVSSFHPSALIVRTSLIYGGATPSPHEQLVFEALEGHNQVAFFTDEFRNPIQVGDLAAALLELTTSDHQGVLHIAGADVVSRYEFAQLIAQAAGRDPSMLKSARSIDSLVRRPRNAAMDIQHAQALLQTRLRGVQEVLGTQKP